MRIHTLFCFLLLSATTLAQINPIDFEPTTGVGGDWTWTVFENDDNPPLEFITNPFPEGINTSQTVAKFTARTTGAPFAGCETMHGADIGTFDLSPDNAFVSIMVYKTVSSDVGVKFATPAGASTGEIKIANTLVNQWQRLVFDFTAIIDEPSSSGIDQLIIFPDFQTRSTENVIYFDNIVFGDSSLSTADNALTIPVTVSPNPTADLTLIDAGIFMEELELFDLLGQSLLKVSPQDMQYQLDMSSLSSGVYIARLKGASGTSSIRIVKQ
ncbi:T9SS type A sorting domain-containing protein [Gilvibacter sediminis]|uniref:T9SS type A sorting domain-containing protein n=1 Tax=Gilvibacter sediminis TaxID=379071 RepID=UPI002350F1B7|nr:T9SS type A sorting domain-containing protein [Gilvibacter sediminis]MDC7996489.1 T9SS type A sorting domain-containing protein [Gilvibacter sediminis]